jgi:hypothetical protein
MMRCDPILTTGFYFDGFYFYPRKRMDAPRRGENG